MARKPARSTRGTISGRPAKETRWPRSVKTRAIPRLGGRLPPPDQFSQIISAIALLPYQPQDEALHPSHRGRARQTKVPAQQFPRVDVEGDNQRVVHLSARTVFQPIEGRSERLADPGSEMSPPNLQTHVHRRNSRFIRQPADHGVADLLVKLVSSSDEGIHVPGDDRRLPELSERIQRLREKLLLVTEDAKNRSGGGAGAFRDGLDRHLLEGVSEQQRAGTFQDPLPSRRGGFRPHPHHIGPARFHVSHCDTIIISCQCACHEMPQNGITVAEAAGPEPTRCFWSSRRIA